jgi:DNA-binding response OmpR family regulator
MLSPRRFRVLCVDDNEDSREMLISLLGISRIKAIAAGTAAQALALIQTECFDLYVLDAWLPEIDGFELCRRIRVSDPETPIVFFSGAASGDDRRRGIKAGATAYVIKPDIEDLIGHIRRLISEVAHNERELMKVATVVGRTDTVTSRVPAPTRRRRVLEFATLDRKLYRHY